MTRGLRGLLALAARGVDLEPLGPLGTFEALSVLWNEGWLGTGRFSPRATAADVRVRLRELGRARIALDDALDCPAGSIILARGVIAGALLDGVARLGELRWIGPPESAGAVTVLGFTDPRLDPDLPPPGPRRVPRRLWIGPARLPAIACRG
jgi:hypothetical protein